MKNRIVCKISFELPQCFPFRMLTIWINKSAPQKLLDMQSRIISFFN
jgi:hypothetical protein